MNERKPLIELFLTINSQVNLSAIRDEEGVYVKHIQDSLELTKILDLAQYNTLCDVGTGGGFPLLALSKYKKDNNLKLQLTGLDARRKKIDAINLMSEKMGFTDSEAIRSRVEEHKQVYDIVTARAVAYADKIIPRCVPLCKKGGLICLYKEVKEEEKEEIIKQCKKFQLTMEQEHKYRLFDGDIERVIYVLRK